MQRRFLTGVGVLAAAGAVCSPATAATKLVYAGGTPKFQQSLIRTTGGGVDEFLTPKVTIHVGDTVKWVGASLAGGFHTVDIPKLAGRALPLITATGNSVSGINDAAGNPFWFNGKVPALGFNQQLFGPSGPKTYNGTTRVESGLPVGPGPHDFAVKFQTAGSFKYFCDVHPGMVGYVVVQPKTAKVPTAAQDAAAVTKAQNAYVKEAKALLKTKVPAKTVSLGLSGAGGLEVFGMFPASLTVPAGTTVTFAMSKATREAHTASFGSAKYLGPIAAAFTGPAGPGAIAAYPSDPKIVLTPSSHGNGFANTGVLDRDPSTPNPASDTVTFAAAGTYQYICLVHPFMHGTIVVK